MSFFSTSLDFSVYTKYYTLSVKPTPKAPKKDSAKLPNTGIMQTETTILGMLMLLLTGFVARLTRTKKN